MKILMCHNHYQQPGGEDQSFASEAALLEDHGHQVLRYTLHNNVVGDAVCLVLPSIWYEGFPRTILEAFAKGTPVIASRLGSMAELSEHGQTGLHFEPASASDLVAKLLALYTDCAATARMRQGARRQYELKYTAEPTDHMLMQIYQRALRGQRRLADDSNISATPLAPHLAEAGVLSNGSVEG
jgi:glycosyltransferase involved in cell wall biosynthesis